MKKLMCFVFFVTMILALTAECSECSTSDKYSGYFGLDGIVEISGGNSNVIIPEPPLGMVTDSDSETFNIISPHDKKIR